MLFLKIGIHITGIKEKQKKKKKVICIIFSDFQLCESQHFLFYFLFSKLKEEDFSEKKSEDSKCNTV